MVQLYCLHIRLATEITAVHPFRNTTPRCGPTQATTTVKSSEEIGAPALTARHITTQLGLVGRTGHRTRRATRAAARRLVTRDPCPPCAPLAPSSRRGAP
eukprot:1881670-Prymnesium_polylepis.1